MFSPFELFVRSADSRSVCAVAKRPSRVVQSLLERQAVAVLFHRLPPAIRDVFLLHRALGLSQSEIALRLRVSAGEVERRLAECMQCCALSAATRTSMTRRQATYNG